ncbi:MAG TPA: hypothetical protein VGV92_09295 [Gammaproteobacteria bacterium]|nr:hypothetical protein [Gammaproteobacteria bacterium]
MEFFKQGETKEVHWDDIKESVLKKNKSLYDIINTLPLTKRHTLIQCKYPYGSKIISNGMLHIANPAGKIVSLDDHSISSDLRKKLNYRTVPVGIYTHGGSEVYFKMENRTITLNLFLPGYLIGLWELFDHPASYLAKRIWSVSAGAKTIIMLPKISDTESHAILQKEFGAPKKILKTFYDQWEIFRAIANHKNFEEDWTCEVLFLSDAWIDSIKNKEKGWEAFEHYLLENAWDQSSYWRNKVTYDLIWEIFLGNLVKKITKPNAHDVSIAKHLTLVSTGILPGFTPATNNLLAPIKGLQDVFTKYYGLKLYIPTIMVPHHFSLQEKNAAVYYSLQLPSLLESSPKSKTYPSLITNLREIKAILENFRSECLNGSLPIEETPLFDFIKKTKMDYFHSEANNHDGIKNTAEMPIEDKSLIYYPNKKDTMQFSENSKFVKGCIRISNLPSHPEP